MSLRTKAALVAPLLLWASTALAAWPAPSSDPTALKDAANWPDDPEYAQSYWLFGFVPDALKNPLPATEAALGVGNRFDVAWRHGRGSADRTIAIVGTGARWAHPDLLSAWMLSEGELPFPQGPSGMERGTHDFNGDGAFEVGDFATDPRLTSRADKGDVNGNGVVDPGDLIALFSDGVDSDGNGLVDDIAGWDFLDGDNDPADPSAPSPGTQAAALAAARTNNGIGGAGACPECRVLPLRVASGAQVAPTPLRLALSHARVAAGGEVVVAAVGGCVSHPSAALSAEVERFTTDRALVSPACDAAYLPSTAGHLIVAALGPDTQDWTQASTFQSQRCGRGDRAVDLILVAPGCADAVPLAAGAVALIGVGEVRASAIDLELAREVRPGHGVGLVKLSDAAPRALPRVDFVTPANRNRVAPGTPIPVRLSVAAASSAFTIELYAARGSAPEDAHFVVVPLSAALEATVDPAALPSAPAERAVVLRAVVKDATSGEVIDARERIVFVHASTRAAQGFPAFFGKGAATAPRALDLTEDGVDELLVVTRDGLLHAIDRAGAQVSGFPVPLLPADSLETIAAQPAFADLDGNGSKDAVVVTLEGSARFVRQDGSLIAQAAIAGGTHVAPAVATTPFGPSVLILSSAGELHLLFGDGTQHRDSPFALPLARIAGPPAVADLNGDQFPDAVVTGSDANGDAVAIAVLLTRDSMDIAPGWPVQLGSKLDALPPVLGDFDRDDRPDIAVGAVGAPPFVLSAEGTPAFSLEAAGGPSAILYPALADLGRNGRLSFVSAEGPNLAVWTVGDANPVRQRSGFPFQTALAPGSGFAIADLNADDSPDIVASTSDAVIALSGSGQLLERWPEPTFDAALHAPAVGLRGDRILVSAATRDGWVYAWNAFGFPDAIQWDGLGHDPQHTGHFGTRLPERRIEGIGEPRPPDPPQGCCSGAPGPVLPFGLVLLLWLMRASALPARRRVR